MFTFTLRPASAAPGHFTEGLPMSTTTPPSTTRRRFLARAATAAVVAVGLTACGSGAGAPPAGGTPAASGDKLVMGFAQVGAESGWRTANTKSIQDSAGQAGVDLKFSDAQQKQENQI